MIWIQVHTITKKASSAYPFISPLKPSNNNYYHYKQSDAIKL